MLRILVVRLSSIGDIVHALPAVSALAETFPGAEIAWAVEDRFAGLLAGNWALKTVLRIDTLGWRRRWDAPGTMGEVKTSVRALRAFGTEVAIDFQGLVKSAVIAKLSGARRRIGFAREWRREALAGVLYNERIPAAGRTHVVEENFALVEHLGVAPVPRGCWRFPLPKTEATAKAIGDRLAKFDVGRLVIVNPGGGWPSKRWPMGNYAELIRRLDADRGLTVLVTGSPSEEPEIRPMLEASGARRARYFEADLMEFIELARRATLLIGGDTGPLHLAAAAGTPIVAIYGPTNPARNGPYSREDIVLTPAGSKAEDGKSLPRTHWNTDQKSKTEFLAGITVDEVEQAAWRRLAAIHSS